MVFQPFFTIDTSRYFKTSYDESPAKQANPGSAKKNRASPVRPPPPSHPPPRSSRASKSSQSVSDAEGEEVGEDTIVKEEAEVTPSPATGQIHSAETPFPGQEESTDAGKHSYYVHGSVHGNVWILVGLLWGNVWG